MKPDYKNWVPKGMIGGMAAGSAVLWGLAGAAGLSGLIGNATVQKVSTGVLLCGAAGLSAATVWMYLLHRTFDYNGNRRMSAQIIDGVASYVKVPEGGKILDVGCGSGALAIAAAKKNPRAEVTGIDRWGKEYASFNKKLCEENAEAEGVVNVHFQQGDATHLDFSDETFDAVTSNYVYHNIPSRDRQAILMETLRVLKKGGTFALHDIFSKAKYGDMDAFVKKLKDAGFEKVELIDTTDGRFMSRWESVWMTLQGSAILAGRK